MTRLVRPGWWGKNPLIQAELTLTQIHSDHWWQRTRSVSEGKPHPAHIRFNTRSLLRLHQAGHYPWHFQSTQICQYAGAQWHCIIELRVLNWGQSFPVEYQWRFDGIQKMDRTRPFAVHWPWPIFWPTSSLNHRTLLWSIKLRWKWRMIPTRQPHPPNPKLEFSAALATTAKLASQIPRQTQSHH